jgi:hypothetical protein
MSNLLYLAGSFCFAAGTILNMVKAHDAPKKVQVHIEEDDPRWNCHTMGNRVCGP